MCIGTAQHSSMKHTRQFNIISVLRSTREQIWILTALDIFTNPFIFIGSCCHIESPLRLRPLCLTIHWHFQPWSELHSVLLRQYAGILYTDRYYPIEHLESRLRWDQDYVAAIRKQSSGNPACKSHIEVPASPRKLAAEDAFLRFGL